MSGTLRLGGRRHKADRDGFGRDVGTTRAPCCRTPRRAALEPDRRHQGKVTRWSSTSSAIRSSSRSTSPVGSWASTAPTRPSRCSVRWLPISMSCESPKHSPPATGVASPRARSRLATRCRRPCQSLDRLRPAVEAGPRDLGRHRSLRCGVADRCQRGDAIHDEQGPGSGRDGVTGGQRYPLERAD